MGIKILKKVGMGIIYYIIGTLFSTLLDTFGFIASRGIFYTLVQALVLGAILCAVSRYLRIAKLKKEHKGDESQEKIIFNSDLKTKVKFILKTQDFKIEAVLFVISAFIIFLVPMLQTAAIAGFSAVFSKAVNIALLLAVIIVIPAFMAFIDVIAWVMAYDRCYKRREY